MKLQHLASKRSSQTIVESIKSYFSSAPKVSTLSESDSSNMLKKVQKLISEFRSTPQFHLSEKDPNYLKLVMLEQALAAKLDEYAGVSTTPSTPSAPSNTGTTRTSTLSKEKTMNTTVPPTPAELNQKVLKVKDPALKAELDRKVKSGNPEDRHIAALALDAASAEGKLNEFDSAVSESGRVVARIGGKLKKAVVYRDSEWDEYVVRFFRNGKYESNADYHTDDKDDAIGTANNWVGERSPVIENREYSIRYVEEDDVWAVVDSVGNQVESFIEKHEAAREARKLNAGATRPKGHRHVNYRGDLEEDARIRPGQTREENYKGWTLRWELKPREAGRDVRGRATHAQSKNMAPIQAAGKNAAEVEQELKSQIDSYQGSKKIAPGTGVSIDFNAALARDIIGHGGEIWADIVNHAGTPTLLLSTENQGGMIRATDRTPAAQRHEGRLGQQAFRLPGRKAISAGLTHARYSIGEPVEYMPGVAAYPLEFQSEVYPGEVLRLSGPGLTVAYPRGVSESASGNSAGWNAGYSKKPRTNPHPKNSKEWKNWEREYDQGKEDRNSERHGMQESANTKYAIKDKKTGKVLSTSNSKEEAEDELAGLGADKDKYTIEPTTKGPKDWDMKESKKLQQASTKQLVEFYRKHRGTAHKSVKLVEAELKRRQRVVEAKKSGRKMISESEIQLAQVVLAAQEMVDQVQKMVEQASATQYKDLPALVSQVRIDLGADQSAQFNQAASEAFQGLLASLQDTKNKLEAAVGIVTGQGGDVVPPIAPAATDMPAEPDAAAADLDLDLDAETDDITGLGRERR